MIVLIWNKLEKLAFGILGLMAVVVGIYGILSRYFFASPLDWTDEIIIYMIMWAVFLAASTLAEERGHVAATLLVERFPPKIRRILAIFNGLLIVGFCFFTSFYGFRIVVSAFLLNEKSLTSLRFPIWIAQLCVALGCMLIGIRYMRRIFQLLFRFDSSQILETHEMSREVTER